MQAGSSAEPSQAVNTWAGRGSSAQLYSSAPPIHRPCHLVQPAAQPADGRRLPAGVDCALSCLDVSPDGSALLAVGRTAKQKPLLVLWDISQAHAGELCLNLNTPCARLCLRKSGDIGFQCRVTLLAAHSLLYLGAVPVVRA